MSNERGRPVLGALFGLLFGCFLAADMLLLGVIPLESPAVILLPGFFLGIGILGGVFAPLSFLRR